MSQENAEFVRAAVERFAATGEPLWDALHTDVEVHDHDIVDAGEYLGHAGFGRWLEDWAAAWGENTPGLEEFIDADERVVAFIVQKTVGQGSGLALDRKDAMVFK
jgi:hypothetical protein